MSAVLEEVCRWIRSNQDIKSSSIRLFARFIWIFIAASKKPIPGQIRQDHSLMYLFSKRFKSSRCNGCHFNSAPIFHWSQNKTLRLSAFTGTAFDCEKIHLTILYPCISVVSNDSPRGTCVFEYGYFASINDRSSIGSTGYNFSGKSSSLVFYLPSINPHTCQQESISGGVRENHSSLTESLVV